MIIAKIAKTFPAISYWARLPGFAAFCGVSAGICLVRTGLALIQPGGTDPSTSIPTSASISIWPTLLFALMIVFGSAGILCRRTLLRTAFFALCGIALFAGKDLGLRDFYRRMEAVSENQQVMTLTVRISSPVAEVRAGYRFRATVARADDAVAEELLRGKTLQFMSRTPVPAYGALTVRGRYALPRPAAGPLGYDQREHFAINNISGSFSVSRVLSDDVNGNLPSLPFDKLTHTLRTRVHKVINLSSSPTSRAILHAAFLDEKEHLTDDLNLLLRKSGIVHLLAISGFHAALLYAAVFTGLGLLGIPPRYRKIISLAALWGYLFFIGFIPSLFRTTVMATFVCISLMLQRKNHVIHTLGVSAFFWLCLSPHSLFAPGFQLSFAATAGIVLIPPVFEGWAKGWLSRIRSKPAAFIAGKTLESLWMSIAATLSTAPPLLCHFWMLSLYGILYNMIAIPLMAAAMWAFLIALVLSPAEFLSNMAVWCAEAALRLLVFMANPAGYVPLSEVVFPKTTNLQIFAMSAFIVGLCLVRKDLRGAYALRGGAPAMLIIAATAVWSSMQTTTKNLEFRAQNSAVNVIIHPDNKAWVIAQGRRNEIRNLRTREIEPLLYRKRIKDVPLLLINENAEEEAHEFAFSTGTNPRTVVIRNKQGNNKNPNGDDDGYTRIDGHQIININGSCTLKVNTGGRVEINVRRQLNNF